MSQPQMIGILNKASVLKLYPCRGRSLRQSLALSTTGCVDFCVLELEKGRTGPSNNKSCLQHYHGAGLGPFLWQKLKYVS